MKPGALIAKKFRLIRRIGEGAMGEVWAATNESTGGEFALKFILRSTRDLRERLMREARAAGGIKHPNVIEIHDVGETDEGEPFLVMPLLIGETLSDLLARTRRLEVPDAARIGRDVARALAAAHAKQIIHRDLKPANIFLEQLPDADEPVVKVLDFGVSKNLEISDGLSTVTGAAIGSPAYMSPEQAKTERAVDHRTDLWSLGVVLFEMLAGQRPFQGEANQLIIQTTTTDAPRLSRVLRHVDPALDALVARCLERDRYKRVSAASELANELQRFTSAGQASALQQSGSNMASPFAATPAPSSSPSPTPGFDRARIASRPDLDVARPDAAPLPAAGAPGAAPPMYAMTAPLSAFGRGPGPTSPFVGAAAPSAVSPGSAFGDPSTRPPSAPQILEPPQRTGSPLPRSGSPELGQLHGTVPMVPTTPHSTMPLGRVGPPSAPPSPDPVGLGTNAGASLESDSALRRMKDTLPLTRAGAVSPGQLPASTEPSPSSPVPSFTRTPTIDPALSSEQGAMIAPRRRRSLALVMSAGAIALGLIGVVVYAVASGPPTSKPAANVEAAATSATTLPATTAAAEARAAVTASVAAPAPSASAPAPIAAATASEEVPPAATNVPAGQASATPVLEPTMAPQPSRPPSGRTVVAGPPHSAPTGTSKKSSSTTLPSWLPGRKTYDPTKP